MNMLTVDMSKKKHADWVLYFMKLFNFIFDIAMSYLITIEQKKIKLASPFYCRFIYPSNDVRICFITFPVYFQSVSF